MSSERSAGELAKSMQELRQAQVRLATRPLAEIVEAIDRVVEQWLAPSSTWQRRCTEQLPDETGFSPTMIQQALPTMITPLRAPALAEILAAEGPERGPALTAQIMPSNLPGLAAIPCALSLACRSATLIKPGRNDRIFPELWRQSIEAVDADLARCVAVHYWPGSDTASSEPVLRQADSVAASGSDTAIANLERRSGGHFVGYGHKLSFAYIARECMDDPSELDACAAALAYDIALWDQRGCLSPRVCFAEASFESARELGARVFAELEALAETLPPGRLTTDEQLDVRRFRDAAEWRALSHDAERVFFAGDLHGGSVVVEPATSLLPAPAHRCLPIVPVSGLDDMVRVLHPMRALLEGAGIAAPPKRWKVIDRALREEGIPYVVSLGQMQQPSLSWRQGGRSRLAPWIIDA